MADHGNTVRGVDYKSAFPFTHLFRGFRLSIDPSKMMLALAALLLLYSGGRLLDLVWPERAQALHDELPAYASTQDNFFHLRDDMARTRDAGLRAQLAAYGQRDSQPRFRDLMAELQKRRDANLRSLNQSFEALAADQRNGDVVRTHDEAVSRAYASYNDDLSRSRIFANEGVFGHFLNYEVLQVDNTVWSAVNLRIDGVIEGVKNFFIVAPAWAFRFHPVFSILFFAWLLLIWSIFGGAIARIAAVQVARDEKISVRQSLGFSSEKVLSFVFAPLIPIIIIALIGLVLAVSCILISVPYVGGVWSVVVGILFFLALCAGLVMMLTALGLIGGGNLMFPTIAAEGTDSFDAVSRSFSYLYARPWQLLFYSLIALIYGAVTYLFVRLSLFVLLLLVHSSVNAFQWGHALDGSPIVDAMWPRPAGLMNLNYDPNYAVLGPVQTVGAAIISFWVFLATSLLGAYAISLYISESTIIYFLMRREVDATEMDDVYLEPSEDELADTTIVSDSSPATAATQAPMADEPMTGEPQGQPVDLPLPPTDTSNPGIEPPPQ